MKRKEEELTAKIIDIFGTTDPEELRRIAEAAECYRKIKDSAKKNVSGRKNSFTDPQLAEILALKKQGIQSTEIAKKYHVSRQTIYSQIKRAYNFSDDPDVKMRMYFMNRNDLCTIIDINFLQEKIFIKNYTQQIPLRAFGVVENPSWADFEQFLEDRCFPRTRDHNKECLRELGVPFYDPLLIIEKTDGYMAGDHQWILTVKKKEEGTYKKYSGNSFCRI